MSDAASAKRRLPHPCGTWRRPGVIVDEHVVQKAKKSRRSQMISAAENELLTRVGRNTPMGKFMRQFWIPACLSSELQPDGPQMRLMLLGEKLIAFRDTVGRVGIFDHLCPHRLASLSSAATRTTGFAAAYHGWKFDVDGNCLDQPNLPDKNKYPAGVKAKAYKTTERGGMVLRLYGRTRRGTSVPEIEAAITTNSDDRNIRVDPSRAGIAAGARR